MGDLSQFDTFTENIEAGVQYQLRNPVKPDEKLDVYFTVRGSGSKAFRQAQREILQQRIGEGADPNADMEIEDECRLVAALIAGWTGVEVDGDTVEYSPENAVELMRRLPWVRDQINSFAGRNANFSGA